MEVPSRRRRLSCGAQKVLPWARPMASWYGLVPTGTAKRATVQRIAPGTSRKGLLHHPSRTVIGCGQGDEDTKCWNCECRVLGKTTMDAMSIEHLRITALRGIVRI